MRRYTFLTSIRFSPRPFLRDDSREVQERRLARRLIMLALLWPVVAAANTVDTYQFDLLQAGMSQAQVRTRLGLLAHVAPAPPLLVTHGHRRPEVGPQTAWQHQALDVEVAADPCQVAFTPAPADTATITTLEGGKIMSPIPGTPDPAPPVALAKADLAHRLGISEDEIVVAATEFTAWRDANLGYTSPAESAAPQLVLGFRLLLETEDQTYEYHTNLDDTVRLCPGQEAGAGPSTRRSRTRQRRGPLPCSKPGSPIWSHTPARIWPNAWELPPPTSRCWQPKK
jgi:hypothetical protein